MAVGGEKGEKNGENANEKNKNNDINWCCWAPYVMPYGEGAPEACYNRQPAAALATWHIYKQGTSH